MARKSLPLVSRETPTRRRQAGEGVSVIAVAQSQNSKLGPVSATTVSIESCGDCPFKHNGCYAQQGPLGWQVARMDKHVRANELDYTAIAQDEAKAIDGLTTGLPLRLHVAGDCSSDDAAAIVSSAAERYMRRNRSQAWTYTHQWRDVSRESWGQVSVLASCETPEDAAQAREQGYAPAMVVSEYPNGKRSWKLENGLTAIPCPEMTGAADSCATCRLCWDDSRLRDRGAVIAFEIHGAQKGKARTALTVLNGQ